MAQKSASVGPAIAVGEEPGSRKNRLLRAQNQKDRALPWMRLCQKEAAVHRGGSLVVKLASVRIPLQEIRVLRWVRQQGYRGILAKIGPELGPRRL